MDGINLDPCTQHDGKTSYVYLCNGHILLISNALETGNYSHSALKISFAMEKAPFCIRYAEDTTSVDAAIIKPDHPHHIDIHDAWHALLLINPESRQAKSIIHRYLYDTSIYYPDVSTINTVKKLLSPFINNSNCAILAEQVIIKLIADFTDNSGNSKAIDPRIQVIIDQINNCNGSLPSINCLAQQVSLSSSRLSHLFSQEMGIPLKQYLLWQKLYHAGSRIARGELIMEAAIAAGFSDAAHFTRKFTKIFGLPPSKILKATESMHFISDTIFTD